MMQLVEQPVIRKDDAHYEAIDQAAFASKNLYNAALYEVRQAFIFRGVYLNSYQMHHLMKAHPATSALPAKWTAPGKWGSLQLGHTQINITMDVYSHLLPGMQEDAMSKLDEALKKQKGDEKKESS